MHDRCAYVLVKRGGASIYGPLTHHLLQIQARFIVDERIGRENGGVHREHDVRPVDDDWNCGDVSFSQKSRFVLPKFELFITEFTEFGLPRERLPLSSRLAILSPFRNTFSRARQQYCFPSYSPFRSPLITYPFVIILSKFPMRSRVFSSVRRSPVATVKEPSKKGVALPAESADVLHSSKNTKFLPPIAFPSTHRYSAIARPTRSRTFHFSFRGT